MAHYRHDIDIKEDITIHEPGKDLLLTVVTILLIIFFPIGIVVFIFRQISRLRSESVNRKLTKAEIESIKTNTHISQSEEIAAYYKLYEQGILSKEEFEAKKISVLEKKKLILPNRKSHSIFRLLG